MPDSNNHIDNPWRRLPWTILISLIIWAGMLWGFGLIINTALPQHPLPMPKPIDAQIIKLYTPDKTVPTDTRTGEIKKMELKQPKQPAHRQDEQVSVTPAPDPQPNGNTGEGPSADNSDSNAAQMNDNASGTLFIDLGYPH
ncbi:hypothetical protein [Candidatus Magnetominusculus dajiuhuensis]|uniref:hypothetical protein n=1 Tax=Candidatus Magnetominusculus dajiuhuensis TaxID=3137712 RepID=UPI003B43AE81